MRTFWYKRFATDKKKHKDRKTAHISLGNSIPKLKGCVEKKQRLAIQMQVVAIHYITSCVQDIQYTFCVFSIVYQMGYIKQDIIYQLHWLHIDCLLPMTVGPGAARRGSQGGMEGGNNIANIQQNITKIQQNYSKHIY